MHQERPDWLLTLYYSKHTYSTYIQYILSKPYIVVSTLTYLVHRQRVGGNEPGGDLSGPEGKRAPRLLYRYEGEKRVQYQYR